MKFGKIASSEINNIDFFLPNEPGFNKNILKEQSVKNPKVYIGGAKWSIPEWIGKIYTSNAKEKDFLGQYTKSFNSIELNATHYKVYDKPTITKWKKKAQPKDFLFCPKMFQGITHQENLLNNKNILDEFLNNLLAFENHLGSIFIQLSENFSPARKDELFIFLTTLPKEFQFFLEVRHPNWFNNNIIKNKLFSLLKELNIGTVITDTSGRRDCVHMHLTIPKIFIRYVSNCVFKTDYPRIDEWIERIKYWVQHGVEEIYFFIHVEDEIYTPELAVYTIDKLNAALGLQLENPKFVSSQTSLF